MVAIAKASNQNRHLQDRCPQAKETLNIEAGGEPAQNMDRTTKVCKGHKNKKLKANKTSA